MSLSLPLPRWSRPAWPAQAAVPLGLALLIETGVRSAYAGAPLTGQRLCEAHAWLALGCLLAVLAARPLRLLPYRRTLGLSAFGFALLHVAYVFGKVLHLDPLGLLFLSPGEQFGWGLGLLALLGLIPLALTSTNAAIRRLGPRWKQLHRITPALTVLATLHAVWTGVHGGLSPVSASVGILLVLILCSRRKVLK